MIAVQQPELQTRGGRIYKDLKMPFQEEEEQDHQQTRKQLTILMAFCHYIIKRNAKLAGAWKGESWCLICFLMESSTGKRDK